MTKIMPNNLKRGFDKYQEEFEQKALEVLRSGWYILGNEVKEFEKEFAAYTGAKHCVGLANGLDALWIAFRILGGDRPSQTAHLTVSPDRIHGRRLETQQTKGGIPRMTPPNLTAWLLSLPPILYMIYRISVLSCSKAPWGLSV